MSDALTPTQMADYLRIPRTAVKRRIANGEIHAVKIGNRCRIPIAEVERYREARWKALVAALANDF